MSFQIIDFCNKTIESTSCGKLFKLSCERFLKDLQREDLEYREEEVERFIRFAGKLKHFTGKHSGQNFTLEDWQKFIVANIIGFYWKGTNRRRYTTSYIEVARKNGKSFLAAVMCLYFLIADKEDGAEVLLAANSKDQAKIAFDMCSILASQLDSTNRVLRCYRSEIQFKRTNSVLKCLAADDSKLDGFNASFGLIDEYHSAKTSKVRDVIKSSQGMREKPHLCTITTAGFDKNSPCYELRTTNVEILKGLKEDDSSFIAIFSIDEEDDWKEEECWSKANPNLGITVYKEYLKQQVQTAINNVSEQVGVVTKNLNVWCEVSNVWINDSTIVNNSQNVDFSEFDRQNVFIGVDLAATGDLTAVTYMCPKDKKLIFKTVYYLPQSALTAGINSYYYNLWSKKQNLVLTAGNVTDYDVITKDILERSKNFKLQCVSYDSWNATQWAIDATAKGLPLKPYSQSIGNFNKPTKEFERLLNGGSVIIDNNPITRFCFKNVTMKTDSNGNTKPSKADYKKKIDGVIAMLMSLGGYLKTPKFNNQIFVI